jgi:oxygen-independent coproporphyrinogen III oxidase
LDQPLVTPYKDLHIKYNVKGSYYTAYPPSGLWSEQFTDTDYRQALTTILTETPDLPLQLYIHFPYCVQQCYYCQCFQLVTNNKDRLREIVDALIGEIGMLRLLFAQSGITPQFKEIHLGGGSPSYLEMDEFDRLVDAVSTIATIETVEEFAIEIDPRTVTQENLKHYNSKGINRISFGIQELDPDIQKAINRIQPIEQIEELLQLRGLFKGVNFDLLYGLPLQTRESLRKTLEKIILLSPDRIALSVLGYRPDVFKHNQKIQESDLPEFIERTAMWEESLGFFLDNGYERIGMDHFAKPEDELAIAKKENRLFRNSMGYSPGRFQDNVSIGPSAMTRMTNYYFQNTYSISDYCSNIAQGVFPVIRGYSLNKDDLIRRSIMNELMTYYRLDIQVLENIYKIDFRDYFKSEITSLQEFVDAKLLVITPSAFNVTPFGNFFLRNICMVFDNLGLEYKHNIESGIAKKSCDKQ